MTRWHRGVTWRKGVALLALMGLLTLRPASVLHAAPAEDTPEMFAPVRSVVTAEARDELEANQVLQHFLDGEATRLELTFGGEKGGFEKRGSQVVITPPPSRAAPVTLSASGLRQLLQRDLLTICPRNLEHIAQAIEHWARDHKGLYPTSIKQMVSGYLSRIPRCPGALADSYSLGYTFKNPVGLAENASLRELSAPHSDDDGGYTVLCRGQHHAAEGLEPDRPAYTSLRGLDLGRSEATAAASGKVPPIDVKLPAQKGYILDLTLSREEADALRLDRLAVAFLEGPDGICAFRIYGNHPYVWSDYETWTWRKVEGLASLPGVMVGEDRPVAELLKARDRVDAAACQQAANSLRRPLQRYWQDHGSYPPSLDYLLPEYLSRLPSCPVAGTDTYSVGYQGTVEAYTLYCEGMHHARSALGPYLPGASGRLGH